MVRPAGSPIEGRKARLWAARGLETAMEELDVIGFREMKSGVNYEPLRSEPPSSASLRPVPPRKRIRPVVTGGSAPHEGVPRVSARP